MSELTKLRQLRSRLEEVMVTMMEPAFYDETPHGKALRKKARALLAKACRVEDYS